MHVSEQNDYDYLAGDVYRYAYDSTKQNTFGGLEQLLELYYALFDSSIRYHSFSGSSWFYLQKICCRIKIYFGELSL